MADHHPALRQLRVDLAQPVGDVLVGQAVKAVAAHPLLVPGCPRSRTGRRPRDGRGGTRCRSRRPGGYRAGWRGSRGSAPDCSAGAAAPAAPAARAGPAPRRPPGSARRNPGRHARPGGRSRAARRRAARPATPRAGPAPRPRRRPRRRVGLVDQAGAAGILGRQMRLGADALELTLERQLEPVAAARRRTAGT